MSVLTLKEAASFLKINRVTLAKMAANQQIPSQKAGREWRFFQPALEKWLSGNYDENALQAIGATEEEANTCQSKNAEKKVFTGLTSTHQTEKEYAKVLALQTDNKRKSTTTPSKHNTGDKKN